jgi:hypothetical protein
MEFGRSDAISSAADQARRARAAAQGEWTDEQSVLVDQAQSDQRRGR